MEQLPKQRIAHLAQIINWTDGSTKMFFTPVERDELSEDYNLAANKSANNAFDACSDLVEDAAIYQILTIAQTGKQRFIETGEIVVSNFSFDHTFDRQFDRVDPELYIYKFFAEDANEDVYLAGEDLKVRFKKYLEDPKSPLSNNIDEHINDFLNSLNLSYYQEDRPEHSRNYYVTLRILLFKTFMVANF